MDAWIRKLFEDEEMLKMGHAQREDDLNLGLGWVYYALARVVRPETVVIIGSWRGFTPLVFAKALADNAELGRVVFIDPSLADDFWTNADEVCAHFEAHGLTNVEHHKHTTQEFVETDAYRSLTEIGMLFIDGMHTQEQAKFDFEAFEHLLAPGGLALFHDTGDLVMSKIYGKENPYLRDVKLYTDSLRDRPDLEAFDLLFGTGVTLVRKR